MTVIKFINLCIGLYYSNAHKLLVSHEIKEMKCVLAATCHFFRFSLDSLSLYLLFIAWRCQSFRFQLAKWTFSTVFKESSRWRIVEPRLIESPMATYFRWYRAAVIKMNTDLRKEYWRHWYRVCSKDSVEQDQLFPPDYLGLCIWDYKRLGYLGLETIPEHCFDSRLGPVRNLTNNFFSLDCIQSRWRDVFVQEL
jgi:hypothetical protein